MGGGDERTVEMFFWMSMVRLKRCFLVVVGFFGGWVLAGLSVVVVVVVVVAVDP